MPSSEPSSQDGDKKSRYLAIAYQMLAFGLLKREGNRQKGILKFRRSGA
ncbi:MAG: hypothetical protein LBT46_06070 [Planctomycetaceae bacterium]|nr:hypothetical protein [Planctomycetaceae bacterium]